MNQTELYEYTLKYLRAMDCNIVEQHPAYITAQLSKEADQDIGGRPYYWLFVERTGAEPDPLQITFILDPDRVQEGIEGERLQFGSWRLHQIFESAKKQGQFVRLYEELPLTSIQQESTTRQVLTPQQGYTPEQGVVPKKGLTPWLYLNYTISYMSDQKKDLYFPVGFNLINGEIVGQFDQTVGPLSLTPKIPDYHFTLSPIFSLHSAIQRMETGIRQYLEAQDQTWAEEAHQRLDEEAALIQSFYEGTDEDTTLQKRLEEVELYRPKIEVKPINIGLIYLS